MTLEFSEALNESLGFSGFISVTRSHTNTISDISRDSNSDSTIIPMTDMAEKTKSYPIYSRQDRLMFFIQFESSRVLFKAVVCVFKEEMDWSTSIII